MATSKKAVADLLEQAVVRKRLETTVTDFRKHTSEWSERLHKSGRDSFQIHVWVDAFRRLAISEAREVWHEHIAPELGVPAVLTLREFLASFASKLLHHSGDYNELVNNLTIEANAQHVSRPMHLITGHFANDTDSIGCGIWESTDKRFRVWLAGSFPVDLEHPRFFSPEDVPDGQIVTSRRAVYVRACANCSRRAFRRFRRESRSVLRCICRSIEMTAIWSMDLAEFIPDDEKPGVGWSIEARLLDVYYAKATKKDSIDRRIRNALHLLVQADQQRHTAIGLALSVAAIEALVCRKAADVANMFAENTAVILEPDPIYRDAAVDFAKDLYDSRSRVMHGDWLEHEATKRRNARVLAAAVLLAILERRDFQHRMGVESETPDALLNELKRGKWIPGQLTGVSESRVRQLWGAPFHGAESKDSYSGQDSTEGA
jgi:hypothetical protein